MSEVEIEAQTRTNTTTALRRVADALADFVAGQPDLENTGQHEAMLAARDFRDRSGSMSSINWVWRELRTSIAAEIGTPIHRRMIYTDTEWTPFVITDQPDDWPDDAYDPLGQVEPTGWQPLADAHRREVGWDFAPRGPETGTWFGWFEPEGWTGGGDDEERIVRGQLVAFAVVEAGTVRFIHVVTSRRRQGIASALIGHIGDRYGAVEFQGPFTDDGAALVEDWAAAT